MKIVILGAGPAGLYCALLLKKAHPAHQVLVLERNAADVTYGWGVVFSDRTLGAFQNADFPTYEQITNNFVIWDAIDVRYRGQVIRCGGHVIASIARVRLLQILQRRCTELGVNLQFGHEVQTLDDLPEHDLLIAADGVNSLVRNAHTEQFKPTITWGRAKYIWLGAHQVLDAFTFIFHETEHGPFQVHAYPFNGTTSTFIVECDEATWRRAGLDEADEATSLAYCQQLLAPDLHGTPLLANNAKWISFPTLTTRRWHHERLVLLGDAAHTAHFSIGSGTKLAMDDAICLARALETHVDLDAALAAYESERRPVVETFQRAASESQTYFETLRRYLVLDPLPFAFQLLTRSGRVSYDDLRLRDARFVEAVDRWTVNSGQSTVDGERWTGGGGQKAEEAASSLQNPKSKIQNPLVTPPPLFAPLHLRELRLPNRVVVAPRTARAAMDGLPTGEYGTLLARRAAGGAGLVLVEPMAVTAEGRITPGDAGLYTADHAAAWARIIEQVHAAGSIVGLTLNHAGRRGSTRSRTEGLDRPLRADNWPLLAPSPLPYNLQSQVPGAMDQAVMDAVRAAFVQAAQWADAAGVDLLQLHCAHGYLLASFLSPLSNRRDDAYGGDLDGRLRYPLEVLDAVRAAWPASKPLAVALTITDGAPGGLTPADAVAIARQLKAHGCDLVHVLAGQTTSASDAPYGRGFLTPLSDRLRNEAGVPTLVGGYLTTANEINTILAAARADLCVLEVPDDDEAADG